MRLNAPRGTRDIIEGEAQAFSRLETLARGVFIQSGFEEIRLPTFESEDLFRRAVGDTTDIVEKELYTFQDRGGRPLALRPEGTAGVVRAYLEHHWDQSGGAKKLFYMGPMFRAERPQAGRYREFWQIGAEYFGSPTPEADAELLLLAREVLTGFGLSSLKISLNSLGCADCRPAFQQALITYLSERRSTLCEDCQRRLEKNPLRCLDCKIDGPALQQAPSPADHLCETCRRHDQELDGLLRGVDFPFERQPRLVRGLDYYTRTVFEITSQGLGSQDAVAAGGRYDRLVHQMGGPDQPAVGFALGMDRVVRALSGDTVPRAQEPKKIFVAVAGESVGGPAFQLMTRLRQSGWRVELGARTRSLKSQLRAADAWGAKALVIVGESEWAAGQVAVKDLRTQGAQQQAIAPDTLEHWLTTTLGRD